jgi:hypothetical protein
MTMQSTDSAAAEDMVEQDVWPPDHAAQSCRPDTDLLTGLRRFEIEFGELNNIEHR